MTSTVSTPRAWPIGATIFTLVLAACFAAYAMDVYSKARGATDWMMVLPAAGIGVVALLVSLFEDVLAARRGEASPDDEDAEERLQTLRGVGFMALLCIYVAAIPYAGFDTTSFVFLALSLILQGERRLWFVLLFATVVTVPVVWLFIEVLLVPLPTLVL